MANSRSKKQNNRDDIPIIDNAYNLEDEEAAETVFEKLIKNARNLDKNSRSHKITEFFDKVNDMNLNNNKITQSDYANESETEIIEKLSQWEQKLQETKERIQHLINTNEVLKTDKVKYISAIHYIKLLQNNTPKLEASRIVAHIYNGTWAKKYLEDDPLSPSQYEKHLSKSLLHDERWINKMRFNYKKYKKSVYVDSYKRKDVIVYCREFLQKIEEYDRLMPKWNDINCEIYEEPNFLSGEKKYILIIHDECVFHTNDGTYEFWDPEEEQPLRKKGLGKELHVSEFLTETIRRLKDEEGEARVIVETDGSQDENWNEKKLLSQVKNAIGIFERMHPECIGIWAFDNATSYTVMAPDALQPKMRNTTWNGETKTMVYLDNYKVLSLRLEPKGMKAVLDERGLWKDGLQANYFLNERGLIQQEIEKNGHKQVPKKQKNIAKNNTLVSLENLPSWMQQNYNKVIKKSINVYENEENISIDNNNFTQKIYKRICDIKNI
ncbi:39818_t:CDS:2, partial [Gigaspora margarita]